MIRRILLACCCALLTAAAPPTTNSHAPITLVINGDRVSVQPAIEIVGSTIFVPLRKILDIFGLPFDLHGKRVTTQVGSSVVIVTIGSDIARVDDRLIRLNFPVREIHGAAYVPLRFVTDVLGAQATYDSKRRAVEVSADHIGITGSGVVRRDGRLVATGTVSAVDLLTDPPTVTLVNNGVARTYPVSADVTVTEQDMVLNVRTPGELASIHPGDFARVALGHDGRAQYVTDAFGSRAGRIIAVGSGLVLLDDGEMVRPVRGTTISLNGTVVTLDALRPDDRVVVRYNVESGETREILASRSIVASAQVSSTAKILSLTTDTQRPLRAGEVLHVTMQATPGGQAWFDIGPFVQH
ncbi:MAG: copper amine oxidase N-terminal domain-containing protein, partial [Vulcanimicrobiaceae bacterium]